MDLQCSCNSLSTGQPNAEPDSKLYNFSQINHASIAGEQSADIMIVTDEGDKVTLSLDTQIEASLTTYNRMARTNTTYTESHGKLISFNASQQIGIGVEGELDNQEKKEIKKVIKAIFKMIKDFLSGKNDHLTERVRNFADLKTISNVKAEFEFKKSTAFVNHLSTKSVMHSPVPENSNPSHSQIEAKESNPIDKLTDQMVQLVKDAGIKPAKLLKSVDRMFSKLFREFLKGEPAGREKMGLGHMIMAEFFHKLEKLSAESEENDLQETAEVEKTGNPSETAHLENNSLLQISLLEQSKTFRMEYSART